MLLVIKKSVQKSRGKWPCTHFSWDNDEYDYSNFWITGFASFKGSHVTNTNPIEVNEVSKCRGINHLSYWVTFLYLQITNLNKKGYQTMSRNFLVVLYFILGRFQFARKYMCDFIKAQLKRWRACRDGLQSHVHSPSGIKFLWLDIQNNCFLSW